MTKPKQINRGYEQTRKTDTVKNVTVGIVDHDSAVMYYFNEVIKPHVIDNGETVKVPVLYANQERWKSIRKDGYIRDKKKQIITPVIAFKRTNLENDDTIATNKMDASDPLLFHSFEKKYTQENRYDQFSVLIGIKPSREFYNVAVPNYVTLNYDFIIWTSYVEQMNRIVERINWTDGSYWGEPGKLKFRSNIDSFSDASDLSDAERLIKTEFSVTLRGYLVPEDFSNQITTRKSFSPKILSVTSETVVSYEDLIKK